MILLLVAAVIALLIAHAIRAEYRELLQDISKVLD